MFSDISHERQQSLLRQRNLFALTSAGLGLALVVAGSLVEEQRGSDVTQAFVIRSMTVDPKGLTSDVTGTLKTFVGAQVIASDERRFRFSWTYRGLRLALAGFAQLPPQDKSKEAQ